jgi:hypothetical protein
MPKLAPSGMSCAVRNLSEFAKWTDPAKMLKNTPGVLDSRAPYITFTAVEGGEKGDYGPRLKDFITQNGFGEVTKIGPAKNHTGSMIAVYVWIVNYDNIIDYFRQETNRADTNAQVAA